MIVSKRDLAKIHIARKDLGLDEETYRALLMRVAGVDSAAQLKVRKVAAVLDEFQRLGWKPRKPARAGRASPRPALSREALVSKIEAQLAEAARPWAYADALALRMFQVERVEWLDVDQLRRLVAALAYDARRHGRPV